MWDGGFLSPFQGSWGGGFLLLLIAETLKERSRKGLSSGLPLEEEEPSAQLSKQS
jgi:hypothetical protein